jgi:hypothetical protein
MLLNETGRYYTPSPRAGRMVVTISFVSLYIEI